jgi:hypothetical protein
MTQFYLPSKGPESWKEFLAEPDKQWKTGYSARSLANCRVEAQGFPESVSRVFKSSPYPLFHSLEFILGIPEHQVDLPPEGGRPSQNDLFVLTSSRDEFISIAVEGKVSESFGKLVSEWNTESSSGKLVRLEFLIDLLEINNKDISKIRYQILHRAASVLREAERFCAPHALLLVHSFSQEHQWFEDYAAFARLYGIEAELNTIHFAGEINGRDLYSGWVTGEKEYLER